MALFYPSEPTTLTIPATTAKPHTHAGSHTTRRDVTDRLRMRN